MMLLEKMIEKGQDLPPVSTQIVEENRLNSRDPRSKKNQLRNKGASGEFSRSISEDPQEVSQVGPPGLWVVATPIGNLSDASPRMRMALQGAARILCEDTRRTRQLIEALGLSVPSSRLVRFDAHTERSRTEGILKAMLQGETLALVSDAGTPAVSDPGAFLVRKCHEVGVPVTPIPGPSAVTTLLSVAGLRSGVFMFRGYFPRKNKERERELKAIFEISAHNEKDAVAFVFFESPNRVLSALEFLQGFLEGRGQADILVAKELTKKHERFFSGEIKAVSQQVREELEREGERGEWCFLLEISGMALTSPKMTGEAESAARDENCSDWVKALQCLLESGVSPSASAKKISQYFGISRNEVYKKAHELFERK